MTLDDDLVYAWIHELNLSIKKAANLVEVFGIESETSEQAIVTYAAVVTFNFKIINLLFGWSTDIPQHHMTELSNQISGLKQLLQQKLESSSDSSDPEIEGGDDDDDDDVDVSVSPKRPPLYRKRVNTVDFQATKFFHSELKKFEKFISFIQVDLSKHGNISSTESSIQQTFILFHVRIFILSETRFREFKYHYFRQPQDFLHKST